MRLSTILLLSALTSGFSLACSSSSSQVTTDGGSTTDAANATDGGSAVDAGAAAWAASGLDGSIVSTIAVDRKNPSTVFIGLSAGGAEKGLWRTKDGGKNWTKLAGGLPDRFMGFVTIHPQTGTVFANPGADGLWHSEDGGDTWAQSTSWQSDPGGTNGIICHPTQNVAWTVSSQAGVFRTNDGGVSWLHTPNTNLPLNQFTLGPLAFDGAKLYLGTYGHGIYVSTDSGDTWTQAASANLPTTDALSEVLNIATSPSRPGVLFVKTNGGLFKSTDGAASFTKIEPGGTGPRYAALLMDPANTSTLFASANEVGGGPGGLFMSTDDGQTWKAIGPDTLGVNVVDIAPDGTLYAGTIGKGVWRFGK
jgi:photosystem II stability/assembly factor-like uncharacterized protein